MATTGPMLWSDCCKHNTWRDIGCGSWFSRRECLG